MSSPSPSLMDVGYTQNLSCFSPDPQLPLSGTPTLPESPEKGHLGSKILEGTDTPQNVDYNGIRKLEKKAKALRMHMDEYLKYLELITNQGLKTHLEDDLRKMLKQINRSESFIGSMVSMKQEKKENEGNLVDNLKQLKEKYTGLLSTFDDYRQNAIIDLTPIFNDFNQDHDKNYELFEKAAEKIKKLAPKVSAGNEHAAAIRKNDEQTNKYIHSVAYGLEQGAISEEYTITTLKNFIEKHHARDQLLQELKTAYIDAIIPFRVLKDQLQLCILRKTLEKIEYFREKLSPKKENTEKLMSQLSTVYPNLEKKQNLKTYLTNIIEYTKSFLQFHNKKNGEFDEFIESKNNTLIDIKKFPAQVNSIEKRYEDIIEFYDHDCQKRFMTQKQSSLDNLQEMQKRIIEQWNPFCVDFYEFNFKEQIFDTFEPIDKKLGWCYTIAHVIKERLDKTISYMKFDKIKDDYRKLSEIILDSDDIRLLDNQSNKKNDDLSESLSQNIQLLKADEMEKLELSDLFDMLPSTNPYETDIEISLSELMKEIKQIPSKTGSFSEAWTILDSEKESKQMEEERAKDIGIVWNNENKNKLLKICYYKKNEYNELLTKKLKSSCHIYDKILPPLFSDLADEIFKTETIIQQDILSHSSAESNSNCLAKADTPTQKHVEKLMSPFQ